MIMDRLKSQCSAFNHIEWTHGMVHQLCHSIAKTPSNKSAHQGCSELIPGDKSFSFFVAIDYILLSTVEKKKKCS